MDQRSEERIKAGAKLHSAETGVHAAKLAVADALVDLKVSRQIGTQDIHFEITHFLTVEELHEARKQRNLARTALNVAKKEEPLTLRMIKSTVNGF